MSVAVQLPEAAVVAAFLTAATATLHRDLPMQNRLAAVFVVGACHVVRLLGPAIVAGTGPVDGLSVGFQTATATAVLLAARGASKWMLRRRRSAPRFGFGLLAAATVFGTAGDGLSPFGPPQGSFGWGSVVLANLAGLLAGLPWFLSKRPVPDLPDPRPAIVWTSGLLALGVLRALAGEWNMAWIAATGAGAVWIPWPGRGPAAGTAD